MSINPLNFFMMFLVILTDVLASESFCFMFLGQAFTFNASFLILHFLDIDECTEGKDNCDRVSTTCRNSPGGFVCYCKPGYSRKDASSCERMLKLGRIYVRNVINNNNDNNNKDSNNNDIDDNKQQQQ